MIMPSVNHTSRSLNTATYLTLLNLYMSLHQYDHWNLEQSYC